MSNFRKAAVAGTFYPASEKELNKMLKMMVPENDEKFKAIAVISPHAGYIYSGASAGQLYGAVEIPKNILLLAPNHHGMGAPLAIYPNNSFWETPLGNIKISDKLTEILAKNIPFISVDAEAHKKEHSIEVQLPFIQYLRKDAEIAAISVGHTDNFEIVQKIASAIADSLKEFGEGCLIVASSDMTHYETAESAARKDKIALDAALTLNPEELMKSCRREKITMCGVVPSAIMIAAAKELGAKNAKLIDYRTSGDVTGDFDQVVGYAAVAVIG